MLNCRLSDVVEIDEYDAIPPGDYRNQIVRKRIGQVFFREAILRAYNNKCCITGINQTDLLIASHIKPWSVCDIQTEGTNPSNGLCLNAFHDKAFDKGLITLDKKFCVIVSNRIKDAAMDLATREWFMSYNKTQINLPDKFLPDRRFIEYHNDYVFMK